MAPPSQRTCRNSVIRFARMRFPRLVVGDAYVPHTPGVAFGSPRKPLGSRSPQPQPTEMPDHGVPAMSLCETSERVVNPRLIADVSSYSREKRRTRLFETTLPPTTAAGVAGCAAGIATAPTWTAAD